MSRSKTPSFILELPLRSVPSAEKRLSACFEAGRQLYNACLGEAMRRLRLMRESKVWAAAKRMGKGAEKNEAFKSLKASYGFREYDLHSYVGVHRRNFDGIDIHTAQKIATRAFRAAERASYKKAKVRFKGYNQLHSMESKSNSAGIRFRDGSVHWGKIKLKAIINLDDPTILHGLQRPVKFCRIIRRMVKGRTRFHVQLLLDGKPYVKETNKLGEGVVGMDFGPSTLAVVATGADGKVKSARLIHFCKELKNSEAETRRMQRKIDRQRRSNNPDNFLSDGTIRKGRKTWKKSARQAESEAKRAELQRRTAAHRKSLHGKLSNEILRTGNAFKTEAISGKWFQKLFGKSVGTRAPKMFIGMTKRKAESAGAAFIEFPTASTRLSQTCVCGRVKKKALSEREHVCECGVRSQRDLFSGFLAVFVEDQRLQVGHALAAWPGADKLLRMAWKKAEYAIGGIRPSSFGGLRRSRSISSDKGRIARGEAMDVVAARQREPWRVEGGSYQIKTLVSSQSASPMVCHHG